MELLFNENSYLKYLLYCLFLYSKLCSINDNSIASGEIGICRYDFWNDSKDRKITPQILFEISLRCLSQLHSP